MVEWEAEMSTYSQKTMEFVTFKSYIKKNEPNDRLTSSYAEYVIRKLELESYMQAQITEALLHARFL